MQIIPTLTVLFLSVAVTQAGIVNRILQYIPSLGLGGGNEQEVNFCNGYDCPKFEKLEKHDVYEVRKYVPTTWVATTKSDSGSSTFMKLFYYIQGSNAESKKIAMTVPVIGNVTRGEGRTTMGFYLPPKVGVPPAPTDATVFIRRLPELTAYVIEFGGYANAEKNEAKANELRTALNEANVQYEKDYYFTAGYDSPMKFWNRHNEVWFIAK